MCERFWSLWWIFLLEIYWKNNFHIKVCHCSAPAACVLQPLHLLNFTIKSILWLDKREYIAHRPSARTHYSCPSFWQVTTIFDRQWIITILDHFVQFCPFWMGTSSDFHTQNLIMIFRMNKGTSNVSVQVLKNTVVLCKILKPQKVTRFVAHSRQKWFQVNFLPRE